MMSFKPNHLKNLLILPFCSLLVISSCSFAQDATSCISRINHHRNKYGVPLITERTDLHSCANRQSQYDKIMGAHKSYSRCGGIGSQGSGGGSNCAGVIDMFVNERWYCGDNTAVVFGAPFYTVAGSVSLTNCRKACMNDDRCLSFSHIFDSGTCRFFDNESLTLYQQQSSDDTLWLGSPATTASASNVKVDVWQNFTIVETAGAHTVPMDGQITSFKWFGSNTSAVRFFMFRLVDGNIYSVVGTTRATSTTVGAENTLTLDSPIQVQQGDLMGWTFEGAPAFGFAASLAGHIKYSNKNTGGPTNVDETFAIDMGAAGRIYHVAASFTPDSSSYDTSGPAKYCAAALCQGHCGPVMGGTTTTFSWGEYKNHYTLNWRPNARIPGGNTCPSGIEAVKCWKDTKTGILWAYGVGGEDCHSTCSLAGASPSKLMCDENTPITGGFTEVSKIMSNFVNDFNANDSGGYTCTTGKCWSGLSSNQVRLYEYDSQCYVPSETSKYVCDSKFGNANCYGQRFNQLCPCVPGCSWAAAGDCDAPTSAPTTSTKLVQIRNKALGNWCMTAAGKFNGANILLKKCSNTNALQKFQINSSNNGLIHLNANKTKCVKKVLNNLKVWSCNNVDAYKFTVASYGPVYWTKAKLNKTIAVMGDVTVASKPLILTKYQKAGKTHNWTIVMK